MSSVKVREIEQTVNGKEYRYWQVTHYDARGNRIRRKYPTKKEAEAKQKRVENQLKIDAEKQKILSRRIGEQAKKLSSNDLFDAAQALEILSGRTSLAGSARFYMEHNFPGGGKKRVHELIADYLKQSEANNLRPTSLYDLKTRLARFEAAFSDRWIHEVTTADIDKWLVSKHVRKADGKEIAPLTRKHYLVVVGGLFEYAIEKEFILVNPVRKITHRKKRISQDEKLPEILRVEDVQKMMNIAEADYPSMVPAMALGFFAGIRTGELLRLDWKNINLAESRITIPPTVAKKRSVRHIAMQSNLKQWLAPYKQDDGLIAPDKYAWRARMENIRTLAKITYMPSNAMRHSYASYRVAQVEDAAKVALELGHRSQDLLFNHYRGLATKEDAELYWKILPTLKDKISSSSQTA